MSDIPALTTIDIQQLTKGVSSYTNLPLALIKTMW